MPDETFKVLPLALRQARDRKKYSLQKVADEVGVTKSYIWKLEQADESLNPSLNVMIGLAELYGMPLSRILGEPTKPKDIPPNLRTFNRIAKNLSEGDIQHLTDLAKRLRKK